jgi:hypothetical protein
VKSLGLRLVGDAHAQSIRVFCVTVIPHYEFEHPSRWYGNERREKLRVLSRELWHFSHTKCNEFPSNHYFIIQFVQMDMICEAVRLGWVSDAQALMVNGVTISISRI